MPPVLSILVASSTVTFDPLEIDARLEFLEERLEGPKVHARAWYWGWLSFYSAAAVAQTVRLGFVDPADEDAAAQRADLTVSIVKAAGGILSLIFLPLSATEGAASMHRAEGDLAKLAAGEAALLRNAEESERRTWWLRHTLLVAVNVIGGLIVWLGYDDLERAALSTAVGIAVGETVFWTQPWQPRSSWREYRMRTADVAATP